MLEFLWEPLNVGVSIRWSEQVEHFGCRHGVMGGGRNFNFGRVVAVVCMVDDETLSCRIVSRNCSSVGFILALTRILLSVVQ